MEKIDLSKMLISDSEFYNKYSASAKFFDKYNITTLEQLLDPELLENRKSLHKGTQTEIKLIISMIKHKYFGESIVLPEFLDEKVDCEFMVKHYTLKDLCLVETDEEREEARRKYADVLGDDFVIKRFHLAKYVNCTTGDLASAVKAITMGMRQGIIPMDAKVIDVLRMFPLCHCYDSNRRLIPFFKVYVEEYDKLNAVKEEISNAPADGSTITDDTLKFLNNLLESLYDQRNKLDETINEVRNKIEDYNSSKGGMKR